MVSDGHTGEPGEAHEAFRHSYTKDRGQLLRRVSRIEGQVRGIERMVEGQPALLSSRRSTQPTASASGLSKLGSSARSPSGNVR